MTTLNYNEFKILELLIINEEETVDTRSQLKDGGKYKDIARDIIVGIGLAIVIPGWYPALLVALTFDLYVNINKRIRIEKILADMPRGPKRDKLVQQLDELSRQEIKLRARKKAEEDKLKEQSEKLKEKAKTLSPEEKEKNKRENLKKMAPKLKQIKKIKDENKRLRAEK